jgi:pimeloyl-ACP methyl ester carboxylesterase
MRQTIPTPDTSDGATPVLSFTPVVLPIPGRPAELRLRVTAPTAGHTLPTILLSHGHGPSNYVSSLYGYAPLADFYAAHGFAVIQPTHLDSATLGLRGADDPEAPLYWRSRAQDMSRILDRLDEIEAAVPALAGRLDRDKVAVVGHSMGGHTASLLLGARLNDPESGTVVNLLEPRIKAGVLLAAPGRGGDALSPVATEHYPVFLTTDFSTMTTPALVVLGDSDDSRHLTVAGPAWHADPYLLSPGPKSMLTLFGAEHELGGVAGYDLAETTDEHPERVAFLQHLSCAYLRSALDPSHGAWPAALKALAADENPLGRVESKRVDRLRAG